MVKRKDSLKRSIWKWGSLNIFIIILFIIDSSLRTFHDSPDQEHHKRTLLSATDSCDNIHDYTPSVQCQIAKNICQPEGLFNYYSFHYCLCQDYKYLSIAVLFLALLLVFYLLATAAEDYFCPALSVISKRLKLAPDVAGVTLLALGNGAPDVFSIMAAVQSNAFPIALGELSGAGVFITTVIVGTVAIVSDCTLQKLPFFRDVIFFLAGCTAVLLIFNDGTVTLAESVSFLFFYVIYVLFTIGIHYFNARRAPSEMKPSVSSPEIQECLYKSGEFKAESKPLLSPIKNIKQIYLAKIGIYFTGKVHPIQHLHAEHDKIEEGEHQLHESARMLPLIRSRWDYYRESLKHEFKSRTKWHKKNTYQKILYTIVFPFRVALKITVPAAKDKHWNKILAALYPLTSINFLMLVLGGFSINFGVVPLYAVAEPIALLCATLVWATSKEEEPPKYKIVFLFVSFVVSVVWIYLIANEIVSLLETIGGIFHISEAILGIILAWGNSVSDFVADVVVAKKGLPGMSVAACFAGPLFNMLVGLGIALTSLCVKSYPEPFTFDLTLKENITFLFLIISLLSSLIVVPLCKFKVKRPFGAYLLFLNFLFSGVILAVEITGITFNVPRIF